MIRSAFVTVACLFAALFWADQVLAQAEGQGLANAYPNRIIVTRQDDAARQVTRVFTTAISPQDQTAIRQNFALAGVAVGEVVPVNLATLPADLSQPGTAFVTNSSDYANPLLAGLFVPRNRFYVFLEAAGVTKTALSRPDGRALTTEGAPRVIDGSNKLVLLSAGQPASGIGTLLYPQGTSPGQIQQILQQFGLTARALQVIDNVSISLLASPDTALLTGDAMFADPANDFVLNYAPGMAIYTVETKARLDEVTPSSLMVAQAPTPAPVPAPAPVPQDGGSARKPKAEVPQTATDADRTQPRTEVQAGMDVARMAIGSPSPRTFAETKDPRGTDTAFDTDTGLVTWGAPGLLVYLPDPLTCSAPVYLYDVTYPQLVKRILTAEDPWDYVRSARFNYFNNGCRGDWGSDHRGKILFSHQGRIIGEALFEFEWGESWNGTPNRLT